jgi:hypothetical protein
MICLLPQLIAVTIRGLNMIFLQAVREGGLKHLDDLIMIVCEFCMKYCTTEI